MRLRLEIEPIVLTWNDAVTAVLLLGIALCYLGLMPGRI